MNKVRPLFVRPRGIHWVVGSGTRAREVFDSKGRAIDSGLRLLRERTGAELLVFAPTGEVERRLRRPAE